MFRLPPLLTSCLLLLVVVASVGDAARILAIFESFGRSQWAPAETYLRALERRGHHVTVVTDYASSDTSGNWTEVLIQNPMTALGDFNAFELLTTSYVGGMSHFFRAGERMCAGLLSDGQVQALYRSGRAFDLVVGEIFFTECLLAFGHRLQAPVVQLMTFLGTDWVGHMVGNPQPYAHVPNSFLEHTPPMNFLQRLENTLAGVVTNVLRQTYYLPKMDALMRSLLGDDTIPPLSELERNVSLALVNHHFSHGCPRPLVPNLVDIGGFHVKPAKELPQDIRLFLDGATEGAIYFSMGTNVKGRDWPPEKLSAFQRAFQRLPQRVLWKWEGGEMRGRPDNVLTAPWLPQSDVLAHKNVRAFISHGGLLGVQEAMVHGVPLVGIPTFMDQSFNVEQAVRQGVAIRIDMGNVSEQSLLWVLGEIIHDPRYRDSARRVSQIFQDRPRPPLEEAVHWTEYVIRHRGAPHLRSAALDLAWYQYLLLDVAAALAAAALLLLAAAVFVTRAAARCLLKASNSASRGAAKKSD